ncbi:hypothetical protein CPT32_00035 [Rhizobium sophoriradicis]|nr:hypothetical protein CPT32_00035 [Rhizobium sophoriradicis]
MTGAGDSPDAGLPAVSSVMLGLEPSIHTAPTISSGMDPRLKAEDDGAWGCVPSNQPNRNIQNRRWSHSGTTR